MTPVPDVLLVLSIGIVGDTVIGGRSVFDRPFVFFQTTLREGGRLIGSRGVPYAVADAAVFLFHLLAVGGGYLGASLLFDRFVPLLSLPLNGVLMIGLFGFRGMMETVLKVISALEEDLDQAADRLSPRVGRDLSEEAGPGVVRAGLEYLSVSFVTDQTAVGFWFLAGAAGGVFVPIPAVTAAVFSVLLYRLVTLRAEGRGEGGPLSSRADTAFGMLESFLSFLPYRIAAFLLLVAGFLRGEDVRGGLRCWARDRYVFSSPNTGQTAAVMAGILDVCLGGPVVVGTRVRERGWAGDGSRDPGVEHLKRGLGLVLTAGLFSCVLFLIPVVLTHLLFTGV